jgi:RelA/SpoT family (p)ppGpp synthetase
MTLEALLERLGPIDPRDRALVEKAYYTAKQAHGGQKRKSGEAYFVHCVAVAQVIADLRLDPAVVAAALLHDVVEDTPYTIEQIQDEFTPEIAQLVDGVTKLERVPIHPSDPKGQIRDREAEYLRKTFLAMGDDVRVILIKLADRLHNMRTLGHLAPEQRERIARETLEIFAPLASRLGIWQMKWELEDLGFRYLYPDKYKTIARLIDERHAEREVYMERIVKRLRDKLAQAGIEAEVTGRPKPIYSIWNKMERKHLSFDQIYDVRAVRVIVKDKLACYQVLGIIHDMWRPIAGEFDDYIAVPKDNFYQSLHTAVVDEDGKTLEVQIRTPAMHEAAEYGIAAHWRYKEGARQRDEVFERRIRYLRELISVGEEVDDADEFVDVMKSEVFQDRVYAFTPKGDIIDLPMGATPIDFAYHVHTEIGHRCRGAKVNGRLVSLDYQLRTGDRVEILTSKRGGPSRDWLSPHLGYVKTKRAASKIRQWLRRQDRAKMIAQGHEVLERELKRLGLEHLSHEQVATLFGLEDTDDFLALIGFGDIHAQHIATKVLEMERREAEDDRWPKPALLDVPPARQVAIEGVQVQGTGGLLTNLAHCCNPIVGDEIIGYVTRGRGVTIHRRDCPNILNLPDRERLISVDWGSCVEERYPVPVILHAYDREGLMRDIGTITADEHVNVSDVNIRTRDHIATFEVILEIVDVAQLSRVLAKLEQLPNVIEARRLTQR